jgi:hypothetical protein
MNKWLGMGINFVSKIPFEKFLVKPPDKTKELQELKTIFSQGKSEPAVRPDSTPANETMGPELPPKESPVIANLGNQRPRVHLAPNTSTTSTVTTKETVDYQNREIGKILLGLQRHCIQKFRINGKACDCGQTRHLIDLEGMVEEVMAMVDDRTIYNNILEWISRVGPICTVENVESGKYDDVYPGLGNEARDFRKELLGTISASALFPHKQPEPAAVEEEDKENG